MWSEQRKQDSIKFRASVYISNPNSLFNEQCSFLVAPPHHLKVYMRTF